MEISKKEFRRRMEALGMDNKQLADATGRTRQGIYNLASDDHKVKVKKHHILELIGLEQVLKEEK